MKKYDDALHDVGEFGRYQRFVFFFGNVISVGGCMLNLSYVFLAALPDHWCHVPALDQWNLTLDQIKQISLPPDAGSTDQEYRYIMHKLHCLLGISHTIP